MIRLTASLAALALFSTAAAAQGIDINSAATIGSNSFAPASGLPTSNAAKKRGA